MPAKPRQSRYRLANQILDLMREAHFQPGHHLREQQFGELLGVSRTPVRAAFGLLAEQGLVEARRNQGYFLTATPEKLQFFEVEVPATADQALYSQIVKDRLSGDLPESFTQAEILRRYDIDRTLLQKTLSQMVNDGLLMRNSGRGWAFKPALDSKVALRDSYEFRTTIEPAGLLLDSFSHDKAAIEKLRLQHHYLEAHPDIEQVGARVLFETDAQFHEVIAEFSGNMYFLQAIEKQNRLRRLLEFSGYANRRRVREWCREHLRILDAISNEEMRLASDLMRDHLQAALSSAPYYKESK